MGDHYCKAMKKAIPQAEDIGVLIIIKRVWSIVSNEYEWYLAEEAEINGYWNPICQITHCPWCGKELRKKKRLFE